MTDSTPDVLIEVATRLFAAKGFDGVSVKEISEAAKVNISLVSYHFGGKEALYRACLERFGRDRLELAQRLLTPAETLEELQVKLGIFIDEMWRTHIENPDTACLIHRDQDFDVTQSDEIFKKTFFKIFGTIVEFIAHAQRKKVLRKDVDPMAAAMNFLSLALFPAIKDKMNERMLGESLKSPVWREKMKKSILQLFLNGYAAQ